MTRKRIAIFAYNHPESTLPLVKYLAKNGYSVDYYFVTFPRQIGSSAFSFGRKLWFPGLRWNNKKYMKPLFEYFDSDRVRIFLLVLPPFPLRYFSWLTRLFFKSMGLVLKLLRYDYVNIVGQNFPLLDLAKALGSGSNYYFSLHEVTPHYASQDINYSLIDYLLKQKRNIIVHSTASRDKLLEYGALPNCRIEIIPFGLFETYSMFDGHGVTTIPEDRFILYYGTMLPYKGLDVLYQAVVSLGTRLGQRKVVVAGYGNDPYIEKMSSDSRFIVINRFLTNQEIVALNQRALCVVCPYKSASQSGIVSTSYLFSQPIVASNVGGFSEYITDGENGLLVEPNDPAALAEALARIHSDPMLHSRLQQGASQFSSSPNYSWDAIIESYLTVFNARWV